MYEEIAKQIKGATQDGNKTAMFHLQVLRNAHHLAGVEPLEFCRHVGARDSYVTEFHKMIKVAKLMEKHGIKLIDQDE